MRPANIVPGKKGFQTMPDRGCSIELCDRKHDSRGLCKKHADYQRIHGHPVPREELRGRSGHRFTSEEARALTPRRGELNGHWTGDNATYAAAHHRVRALHGPATDWPCSFGCGKQATQWAYCNDATEEKIDEWGRRYSLDEYDYVPACIPCHRSFDRS